MTKLYTLCYSEFAKYVIDLEECLYVFQTNYDKRVVDKLQPTLLSEEILGQEESNKNKLPTKSKKFLKSIYNFN